MSDLNFRQQAILARFGVTQINAVQAEYSKSLEAAFVLASFKVERARG